jgi:site-specific DNA-methyltransferase (adenine-specific)
MKMFKYCWVWDKIRAANFMQASYQPLKQTEDIVVFSGGGASNGSHDPMSYSPQGVTDCDKTQKNSKSCGGESFSNKGKGITHGSDYKQKKTGFPNNILRYKKDKNKIHPTQKPVALMEYLIKTYTNENETVLDFTMGSGTTGVACKNLNRNFIGIELDETYFNIAKERIENA